MSKNRRKFDGLMIALVLVPMLVVSTFGSPQSGEGRLLKWRSGEIVLSVSSSMFGQRLSDDEQVARTIRESFSAWEAASNVSTRTRNSTLQSVSPQGIKGDGISLLTVASTPENLKLFPRQGNSPAANTRVFFNSRGEITEADIVLNPYVQFSTDGAIGTYDLRSVLIHEAGHALGLEHSPVWGSRMFERTGRNSDTSLGSIRKNSLSLSDLSAIRNLYGPKANDVACCTSAELSVTLPKTAKAQFASAWLEEAATGRVVAATSKFDQGIFRFGGIDEGKYRAFVQVRTNDGMVASGSSELETDQATETSVNIEIGSSSAFSAISYVGLNAQLAELPILLSAGQSNRIWVGGKALSTSSLRPRFNYERLFAEPDTNRSTEYGSDIRALSFELRIAPDTPAGDYSVPFETPNGGRQYLIGAITVYNN